MHITAQAIQVLILWDNHLIMPPGPWSRFIVLQCSYLFFEIRSKIFLPFLKIFLMFFSPSCLSVRLEILTLFQAKLF